MNRLVTLLAFALLLFTFHSASAQRWSVAAGPGLTQYIGDVNEGRIGSNRLAFNVEGWYLLTNSFQIKSGFSVYGLRGQDEVPARMRNFRTTNVELYTSAMYYLRRGYFTPFAYAGIGVTSSSPQGESPLGKWDLRDVQPEATSVPGWLAMVPFGVGLEYEITPGFSVVVDAAARYVLSDQLDAMSRSEIPTGELSPLAIDYYESLSDDLAQRVTTEETLPGGNAADNDWYGIFSVKLKFTPTAGCLNPHKYARPVGRKRGKRNFEPI